MALTVGTDSYATLAELQAYIDEFIFDITAWTALTETQKENYAKQATRNIDKGIYKGCKYDVEQDLAFPRTWYKTVDVAGEIPNSVKLAQAYECISLTNFNFSVQNQLATGIKSKSMKSASVSYSDQAGREAKQGKKLDIEAQYALRAYTTLPSRC